MKNRRIVVINRSECYEWNCHCQMEQYGNNGLLNPPLWPKHHDDTSEDGQNKCPSPHAVTKDASLLLLCVSPSPAKVFRLVVSKREKHRNHSLEEKCWFPNHNFNPSEFGQWTHVPSSSGRHFAIAVISSSERLYNASFPFRIL